MPGLTFVQGDAQKLPFSAQSLDAVINVEASHCYPNFPGFLAEVARVLRPGGHFLYADFRFRPDLPAWESAIALRSVRRIMRAPSSESGIIRSKQYGSVLNLRMMNWMTWISSWP